MLPQENLQSNLTEFREAEDAFGGDQGHTKQQTINLYDDGEGILYHALTPSHLNSGGKSHLCPVTANSRS